MASGEQYVPVCYFTQTEYRCEDDGCAGDVKTVYIYEIDSRSGYECSKKVLSKCGCY